MLHFSINFAHNQYSNNNTYQNYNQKPVNNNNQYQPQNNYQNSNSQWNQQQPYNQQMNNQQPYNQQTNNQQPFILNQIGKLIDNNNGNNNQLKPMEIIIQTVMG